MTDAAFSRKTAVELDSRDGLAGFRNEFHFPEVPGKKKEGSLYFVGNSLGLQPKKARTYVDQELEDWARLAVEGHFKARHPWLPYHEFLTEPMARIVGADSSEVVVMNSLTVNLHLMMVSFYRPTKTRYKILIERDAFPSDRYAVASQVRFHGFDPGVSIITVGGASGGTPAAFNDEDWKKALDEHGDEVALVLVGQVNYLTGQAFDLAGISKLAHAKGAIFGADLAHGAGNLDVKLHDSEVDFAVWCGYKYLNGGPGALAGAFVHEKHHKSFAESESGALPRFEGWWGTNKARRFLMGPKFEAIPGAEGWQLSNPPIFSMAALRASLELFDKAGIANLRKKSKALTSFLEKGLHESFPTGMEILTPSEPHRRGCQLSVRFKGVTKAVLEDLVERGVFCDFREPDVIRFAPVPLYTSFSDVFGLCETLKEAFHGTHNK